MKKFSDLSVRAQLDLLRKLNPFCKIRVEEYYEQVTSVVVVWEQNFPSNDFPNHAIVAYFPRFTVMVLDETLR